MAVRTSSTKVDSPPPVAVPHPRLEKTLIDDKIRNERTSAKKKLTASSQGPRGWDQVAPRLGPEIVVEREERVEVFFESDMPLSQSQDSLPRIVKEAEAGDSMEGWEKPASSSPVHHAVEYQKHLWYTSVLPYGMGSDIKGDWGFSSASVSRSHSPNNRH
jgi:hypothetical protein